jgi:CRISPR-associated protein Csb1
MEDVLKAFDHWLADDGPAALVLREHLVPVEGPDGVLFPATFAGGTEGFSGGYNVDEFPDGTNVCLIDSVGSQANRIEPLFAKEGYAGLVPQIVVKAGSKTVNLLEAGHRAGDAIVRCSALQTELRDAFKAVLKGDAGPLAKLAPTSLVFGVWDSRDTQAKLPRLIASTIRAFNVKKLKRSAQYVPAVEYEKEGLLPEAPDKSTKDGYAVRGFVHVPASGSHGGVIATAGIRRDASLHLAGLRLLASETNGPALRRYILGLALTAFTYPASGLLRQGCHLVADAANGRQFQQVFGDGRRVDAGVTHTDALAYANAAAKAFGINPDRNINFSMPPDRQVEFDTEKAQKDVAGERADGEKRPKKGKSAKG